MWPFRNEKFEPAQGISKEKIMDELSVDEKWDLIQKMPKIYGIIRRLYSKGNEIRLDIGTRPNGTPEENKFYVRNMGNNSYFFNEMEFVSDKLFTTPEEGYEHLLKNEETLKEFGIFLAGSVLNYKIQKALKNSE